MLGPVNLKIGEIMSRLAAGVAGERANDALASGARWDGLLYSLLRGLESITPREFLISTWVVLWGIRYSKVVTVGDRRFINKGKNLGGRLGDSLKRLRAKVLFTSYFYCTDPSNAKKIKPRKKQGRRNGTEAY